MKKICMITHDAPYIDRRILLQAKSLIENGYLVDIIYPFGEVNDDFSDIGINYIPAFSNITKTNFLSYGKNLLRKVLPQKFYIKLKAFYFQVADTNFIEYEDELKKLCIDKIYDIYVAHDLPALPIAHFASKKFNAKLVYDAHEFFLGQIALQSERKEFFEKLEKKYIYDVDLMFTVNEDIANLFKEKYNLNKEIKILLNSIEDRDIEAVDLHKLLKLNQNINIILFQGGFLEDRNLEILTRATKFLDDNNVLVMLGYSFLEDKLKKISKDLGILNKKVYFLDRVPQKELLDYSAGATVGIIPYPAVDLNTRYCTPNKMFEFISSLLPILVNNELVTVSKFMNNYKIGEYISFKNEKVLASNINDILNDFDKENYKDNLLLAKEKLSWKNQEKILIDTYEIL